MTDADQEHVEALLHLNRCYRVAAGTCMDMAHQISMGHDIPHQTMIDFENDLELIKRARSRLQDLR